MSCGTKTCTKCGTVQEDGKFRGNVCRKCRSWYSREHYRRDKGPYLARSRKRNKRQSALLREYVNGIKAGKPCMDCGVAYPFYVLDFDHREAASKSGNVGTMIALSRSLDAVKAEIEKCDLVCSNCHRERTWRRRFGKGATYKAYGATWSQGARVPPNPGSTPWSPTTTTS